MPANTEMSMTHHHAADHHDMSEHVHSEPHQHCPEEYSFCCSMSVLPAMPALAAIPFDNSTYYRLLSRSPPIHQPDTLFRPPKNYPFFTG